MRILYILKHNPWGVGGGCMATRSYLEAFLEIFNNAFIDIIVCKEFISYKNKEYKNAQFHTTPKLSKFELLWNYLHKRNHRHQEKALELLSKYNYDVCIFDHSSIAGSLVNYIPKSIKTIVIHHNFECDYYRDNHNWLNNFFMLPLVKYNECESFTKCTVNIFLTENDLQDFNFLYKKNKKLNYIVPPFEHTEIIKPSNFSFDKKKCVITGNLSNKQNLDAILYYLKDLHPLLPKEYKIIIAGKEPSNTILVAAKKYKNVEIISSPQSMDEILSGCNIYICPARLGSGIKVRIKDALRKGIPVVAHDVSSRGYAYFIENKSMMAFSTPKEFINAINKFQNYGEEKREYAYNQFSHEYSFEHGVKILRKILKDINIYQ